MATVDVKQIEDFSDLGQPFDFTYLGNQYTIPPIPPARAKRLISISTKLGRKKKEEVENAETDFEELDKSASDMFIAQVDFIIESGIKKCNEEGTFVPVDKSEVEEEWPTKLVLKVFERINGIIFGSEISSQEKKS